MQCVQRRDSVVESRHASELTSSSADTQLGVAHRVEGTRSWTVLDLNQDSIKDLDFGMKRST